MFKIRFQRDCRPLVRLTVGRGWSQYDLGISVSRAYRWSWERAGSDWYLELPGVTVWRMAYCAPQTVAEAGVW